MVSALRFSTVLCGGAVFLVLLSLYGLYSAYGQADTGKVMLKPSEASGGQSPDLRRLQFKHHQGQAVEQGAKNSAAALAQGTVQTQTQAELSAGSTAERFVENIAREISQASGRDLQALLRKFWQLCSAQDNCHQLLSQLHGLLTPGLFSLLENFTALEQARDQLLGSELISQNTHLEDKIARVKAVNEQVWGQEAELLYRDEYALYDFSLQGHQLGQFTRVEDFISEYQKLSLSWQGTLAKLGLQSPEAKYEQALSLLPETFSETQRARARAELAHLYLTPEQAASVQQRERQVARQADTVTDYQQGLQALNRELAHQRKTTMAHLSEAEWQSYRSSLKYQYRRDFFNPSFNQ